MERTPAKERMLDTFLGFAGNGVYDTFSVAQARQRFGVKNVSARIAELRQAGWPIYTNTKRRFDGSKVAVYRMGTAKRSNKARKSA